MTRTPIEANYANRVLRPASRDGFFGVRLWRFVLAFVAVAYCGPWLYTASACPDPDDETTRANYPFDPQGEEITVKFVFITFPDSDQTELRASTHKRFPEKFVEYFTAISNGKLTFSADTGILFQYVNGELDTFGQSPEDSTAVPWMADLGATHYEQNPNFPPEHPEYQAHHLTQEYLQEWEGRVGNWWVTYSENQPKSNYATELTAEILWKIRENYMEN